MGMDVSGKNARSERGEYFQSNVWWWHPLADYCAEVAPEIWQQVEHPHTNDGSGLNNEDSIRLANVLDQKIQLGELGAYIQIRKAELDALPNEVCDICKGTGERDWSEPVLQSQELNKGKTGKFSCNGCKGTGSVRPFDTMYSMSVEHTKDFADFLRDCGGFEIW